jgi:sec-independent protein translocase protein TatC
MTLIFSFGLVFQLPVVTTLMARVGLLTSQGLVSKRKYAIVLAFVAAAVLTPPDPVSQIGLALPTLILYEVAIYAARLVERQRAASTGDSEPETETSSRRDADGGAEPDAENATDETSDRDEDKS